MTPVPVSTAAPRISPTPPRGTPVQVGVQPSSQLVGLQVALERGWFAEEGLAPQERVLGDQEMIASLAGGGLQFALTKPSVHLLARGMGNDFQAVAVGGSEAPGAASRALLVGAKSPIQSPRDLENEVVAITMHGSPEHLLVQDWLRANGVDPTRVRFTELPVPQQARALATGQVDAITPSDPYLSAIESAGGDQVRRLTSLPANPSVSTLLSYYVADRAWLARNADLAQRFARAIHRANTYLDSNPAEKRAAVAKQWGLAPDLAARVNLPTFGTRIEPAALQFWLDTDQRVGPRPALAPDARARPAPSAPATASELLFDTVR